MLASSRYTSTPCAGTLADNVPPSPTSISPPPIAARQVPACKRSLITNSAGPSLVQQHQRDLRRTLVLQHAIERGAICFHHHFQLQTALQGRCGGTHVRNTLELLADRVA